MDKKKYIRIVVVLYLIVITIRVKAKPVPRPDSSRPNIIFIMTDDLGYGDIGAYNDSIDFTPHIDRLAKGGMRFTDYHANGPMCTPTRAALLTGMYQQRLGKRFSHALSAKRGDKGMPRGVITIAELLKRNGYATGMFGKWHLGFEAPYIPTNYGFQEFRGLLSGDGDHFTHINRWGTKDWWYNDQLNMEEGYDTDLITKHSIEFIHQHKNEPFFLYVPYLNIHFPWQGPNDPPQRQAGKTYENNKWGVIKNENNVRPHVVSMIKALDQALGKIIKKLKALNLEKNTLLIFTSDNGGYTHYDQGKHRFKHISDNGALRGEKTEVYEGGQRVPFIAYWPGKIKPGTQTAQKVMTMDMYPTFAQLAGAKIPPKKKIDGESIVLLLLKNKSLPKRTLFWEITRPGKNTNQWAVRHGPWKLVYKDLQKSLYNLHKDLGETNDVSGERMSKVNDLTREYLQWKQKVSLYAQHHWDKKNHK